MNNEIEDNLYKILNYINNLDFENKVKTINEIRNKIHEISPFKNEPVDYVEWIPVKSVNANDYNPNKVAPPEMELLIHSISHDGFTQPVVTWKEENNLNREVVDGFHRSRVCNESKIVFNRLNGYLPIVTIKDDCSGRTDRIASTIRHNRARGKHIVEGMSNIVLELKNRNWKNERIARELGMDEDEILRLCQITGLSGLFSDQEFSKSWDIDDCETEYIPFTEEFDIEETDNFRTINTDDKNRIFHKYTEWECYKNGFYATTFEGKKKEECEQMYYDLLSNDEKFSNSLEGVIREWKHSCEHYLTNCSMNRIAWLGQAAVCYATGIPSVYRSGFNLLSDEQQNRANEIALIYLNKWLNNNKLDSVTMEIALSGKQMDIY